MAINCNIAFNDLVDYVCILNANKKVKEMFVVDVDSNVMVKAFIMRDEFKTGEETMFLEPKDCTESSREEDSFNSSKSNEAFSKSAYF